MTDTFYLVDANTLYNAPRLDPGIQTWADSIHIYSLLSMVDRVGDIPLPFQLAVCPYMRMPESYYGFNMTYEQCCDLRAEGVIHHARSHSLPISMLYSGGIDSTVVAISLLKQLRDWKDLHFYMDRTSIAENPYFYEKFIKPYCSFSYADNLFNSYDGKSVVVTGEMNDFLFGAEIFNRLERIKPGSFREALEPYKRENARQMLIAVGLNPPSVNEWLDLIEFNATRAPKQLTSMQDVMWWFVYVFKWQQIGYRILQRFTNTTHINKTFTNERLLHFFHSPIFEQWTVMTSEPKHKGTWDSYKYTAKELIHKFDKNDEYFYKKRKRGSLINLYSQRKHKTVAIDSDIGLHETISLEKIYNPNHFFRQ